MLLLPLCLSSARSRSSPSPQTHLALCLLPGLAVADATFAIDSRTPEDSVHASPCMQDLHTLQSSRITLSPIPSLA
jgi:hypothetical protein